MTREAEPAVAMSSSVVVEAAVAFLERHPPFDRMERVQLSELARHLAIGYYGKGSVVVSPASGIAERLHIVQRGVIRRSAESSADLAEPALIGAGEIFPLDAVLEKRPTRGTFTADRDTFCYVVDASRFREALATSARLREYASDYLAALLRDSRRALSVALAARSQEEEIANRPLRAMLTRPPVWCAPQASIREALTRMRDARVGSILVIDGDERLAGILTRHDVLGRITLAGRDLQDPVATVMTPNPLALDADASAHEAALLIAREGFRHIPVTSDGRVTGVVTERDLFGLQRTGIRTVRRSLAGAASVEALVRAAADVRALTRSLYEQGLAPEPLTRIVASLNDVVTARALEIHRAEHDLDGIVWSWLAFGSEGRFEQTLSTDQDNGIAFAAGDAGADAIRERLVGFARAVNATLDACGFPLCKGGIMAGNPKWCLSVEEWRRAFEHWVRRPEPRELLNAVIFFDFRHLYGAPEHAVEMRAALFELVRQNPGFLRQLAAYATESRPPLGLLGGFRGDDSSAPGTLDLKVSAARLFVDAARVLALRAEVPATNTAARLREAGAVLGLNDREVRSAVDAFWFVQGQRLHVQLMNPARDKPNRIDLASLSEVDARMLKESLRQARNLQARLALDYQL